MISSLESIYQKMTPNGAAAAPPHHDVIARDQIGGDVAHELNNIITIIRGYTERMLMKHGEDPTLRPDLQLVCDNARRAERTVRLASQAARRASSSLSGLEKDYGEVNRGDPRRL